MNSPSALLCFLFLSVSLSINAQVSITSDGSDPDGSAMLDVKSSTKGILVPRMSTAQRTAISSPAIGLLIFDTDTESFWFRDSSGWLELVTGKISSIADTDQDTKIQVEESINENIIRFDVAGNERLRLETDGALNINNAFSLPITDGTIGQVLTTDGNGNASWQTPTVGGDNDWTISGSDVFSTLGGDVWTLGKIGAGVGNPNLTISLGNQNTGINNDGSNNLRFFTTGLERMVLTSTNGGRLGIGATLPDNRLEVGGNITLDNGGAGRILIKDGATVLSSIGQAGTSKMFIANKQNGDLGFETNAVERMTINGAGNVGIGQTNPDATLDLVGNFQYVDGNEADGFVLTSDADGKATWQTLPTTGTTDEITDADQDTKIQVEEGNDEDIIRFDVNGVERLRLEKNGALNINNAFSLPRTDGNTDQVLTTDGSGNTSWQMLNADNLLGSDYSCLSLVGSLEIGGSPLSMAIMGNFAYVVDSDSDDLKVIDVSDPMNPVLSGMLNIGGFPWAIVVSGNFAYVVDSDSNDLKIIDVSDPTNPVLSGSLGIGGTPLSIAVSGNFAYVVDAGSNDLKIIDVSDPTNPVLSGSLGIGDTPRSIVVSGNYVYVVDLVSEDLKIIEVSDPTNPVLSGSLGIGPFPLSVKVRGNFAYVVDASSNDLRIIDVSDPTNPVLSSNLGVGSFPRSIAIMGNFAYVVNAVSDNLRIIDISDPTNPVLNESLKIGGSPWSVVVVGNLAHVVDEDSDDLKIIEQNCGPRALSISPQGTIIETALDKIVNEITDIDNDTKIQVEESSNEDIIRFDIAGNEAMVINNNRNVGIGATPGNHRLRVGGRAELGNAIVGNLLSSTVPGFAHKDLADRNTAALQHFSTGTTILQASSDQEILFRFNGSDIASFKDDPDDGGFQFFYPHNDYVFSVENTNEPASGVANPGMKITAGKDVNAGANSVMLSFNRPDGTQIGRVIQNNSNTVNYNTSSDLRLKTKIQPTTYSIDDLMNIEVRNYVYQDEPDDLQVGFIAQQLFDHFPVAVTPGGEDAKTDPWMVDYGKMTPLIVKAVQDQQAIIEAQQAEINQLKEQNERIQKLEQQMAQLLSQNSKAEAPKTSTRKEK